MGIVEDKYELQDAWGSTVSDSAASISSDTSREGGRGSGQRRSLNASAPVMSGRRRSVNQMAGGRGGYGGGSTPALAASAGPSGERRRARGLGGGSGPRYGGKGSRLDDSSSSV